MPSPFSRLLRGLLVVATMAIAASAHAQATRTWISGVGDDANPCSRTAPCKTFAGAISKTATGGEIDTMDGGGFGAVTITKSITLASDGAGIGGILVAGTNGITINAPAGSAIYLRKLVIEGLAGASQISLNGVSVLSGDVHVDDCVIHGFSGNSSSNGAGIFVGATANASRVYVTNTKLYGNAYGILNTSTVSAPVALIDTVIDRNTTAGLKGTTNFAVFSLNRTTVTGSPVGISAPPPSKVNSYGNNLITGIEAGTTLTPVSLQ